MTVPRQAWIWRCRLERVIDADTLALFIDRGMRDFTLESIRLMECWAPERFTPEGKVARAFVVQWFKDRANKDEFPIALQTYKSDPRDKYGRFVGRVWWKATGEELNKAIVAAGHATVTKAG